MTQPIVRKSEDNDSNTSGNTNTIIDNDKEEVMCHCGITLVRNHKEKGNPKAKVSWWKLWSRK
jgi:hypothetical protein